MPQTSTHDKDPSSGRHSSVSRWELKADEVGGWIAETCSFISVQVSGEFGGGKGGATVTNTFRNAVDDTKDRVIATVDSSGNRTAIITDFT